MAPDRPRTATETGLSAQPRSTTQTGLPAQDLDLRYFPIHRIVTGTPLFRAHWAHPPQRAFQPYWFSSDGGGRFDLSPPLGTCYLASNQHTAAREVVGPALAHNRYIPSSLVFERVVSELHLPDPVRAAMTTSKKALLFGCVGMELSATSDYDLTQAWAAAFSKAGFTGVWYQPRFSPPRGRALALFGAAGLREGEPHQSVGLAQVCLQMGYHIAVPPSARSLTVLE